MSSPSVNPKNNKVFLSDTGCIYKKNLPDFHSYCNCHPNIPSTKGEIEAASSLGTKEACGRTLQQHEMTLAYSVLSFQKANFTL